MIWDLGFKIWDWKREIRDANPKSQIQHSKFLRRGVTLMEVLISAGVTAIGLFGVLALVPLAAVQVGKGITEDRKAVLAKSAESEFNVRGMRRQSNWRTYGMNRNGNVKFDAPAGGVRVYTTDSMGTVTQIHDQYPLNSAICIDSRFVEARQGDAEFYLGLGEGATVYPSRFPYPPAAISSGLAMLRVSVLPTPVLPIGARARLADEIFVSQDDLEFMIPAGDRTQPPVQLFSSDSTGTLTTQKRQSAGHYSWMATLVPKHGAASEEYVLSIVVFYKRDPAMTVNLVAPGMSRTEVAEVNERVLAVSQFFDGASGGEVTLQASVPELEAIPQNSWIMLAARTNEPPLFKPDYKWYRVIGADDIDTSGATPARRITLQGADWQRPEWGTGGTVTQATIMPAVVGVFERTIRLETTSLWSQ